MMICSGGVVGRGGSGCSSSMASTGFAGVLVSQPSQPGCGCAGVVGGMSWGGLAVSAWVAVVLAAVLAAVSSGVCLLSSGLVGVAFILFDVFGAISCASSFFGAFESGWDMETVAWSEATADSLSLLRMLAVSSMLFDSKRARSVFLERNVSPWMFSLATEMDAVALGGRGQEPYQLWALRTVF